MKQSELNERVLSCLEERRKQNGKRRAAALLSVCTAVCVLASMALPGVSMGRSKLTLKSDRAAVRPGESVSVAVLAEAGSGEETTFLLSPQNGEAVLSDALVFQDGEAELRDQSGKTLILHESDDSGYPEYWFSLRAGQRSRFILNFDAAEQENDSGEKKETSSSSSENEKESSAASVSSSEPEASDSEKTTETSSGEPSRETGSSVSSDASEAAPDESSAPGPDSSQAEEKQVSAPDPGTSGQEESGSASRTGEVPKSSQSGDSGERTVLLRGASGSALDEAEEKLESGDGEASLKLAWSKKAAEAKTELSQQTLTGEIFTDETLTKKSRDAAKITVKGRLPQGACVKAYPIAPKVEGYTVFAAYDITVYLRDGTVYEPTEGALQVDIRAPKIPDTGCSAYYVPEDGAPEPVHTSPIDGGVQFEANHFTPYMVAQSNAAATDIATLSDLQTAVTAGGTQLLRLTGNITASSGLTIPANSDITLDLNGHSLTNGSSQDALFTISDSSSALTIEDSAAGAETVETVSGGDVCGNAASAVKSGDSVTLTYYVTETEVTEEATGATKETLKKHTVTAGGFLQGGGSGNLIQISAGSLKLQSGMLYGGSNSAIAQSGGTVNLSGGCICGTDSTYSDGGAVNLSAGALNISGDAVLAGNKSYNNGGAVYAAGDTAVTVEGNAVISGNTASRDGGGVWTHGTMTVSGGYITNNRSENGYVYGGGGGVFVAGDSAQFTMSDGKVTGNYSHTTGGGIGTQEHDEGTGEVTLAVTITGGFVSGNTAYADEGGGLTIRGYDTGTVTGGYFTNNKTQTTQDWGGGGIFISENGTLNLENVLVTDNSSDSFGAGVSACSTGKVYLYVQNGAAVYGNKAGDYNPQNGAKNEGYEYTYGNTVFLSNGYQDVFCVYQSTVTGAMLGGGASNWSGSSASCDGEQRASEVISATKAVTAGKNDVLAANALMGLTASPDEESKTAAQKAARVYVNGNGSTAHGGGIMSNGNLVLGTPEDVVEPVQMKLLGTKQLNDSAGKAVSLDGSNFAFRVYSDEGETAEISAGTSDKNGVITFSPNLSFSGEGTYICYISELSDAAQPAVTFDSAKYRLTVTAVKGEGTALYGETKLYSTSISGVKVEKSTDAGATWKTVKTLGAQTASNSVVTLSAAQSGVSFVNVEVPATSVSVQKKWADGTVPADSVQVQLMADGTAAGDPVVLNAANSWFYCWKNIPKYKADGVTEIAYTLTELPISGYRGEVAKGTPPVSTDTTTSTSWKVSSGFEDGGTYLLLGTGQGALANTSGNSLAWAADTSGSAADTPASSEWTASASGGYFTLTNKGTGKVLAMSNYQFSAYSSGEITSSVSTGFVRTADSWLKTVYSGTDFYFGSDFNYAYADMNPQKFTLYRLTSTSTTVSVPVSDLHYIVTNTAVAGYQLPSTGGPGNDRFPEVGAVFMAAALILKLLSRCRRGRRPAE